MTSPDGAGNRHLTSPRNELASPAASLDHRFGLGGGRNGGVGGGALTLAGYRSGAGISGRSFRDALGGGGGGKSGGGMEYGTLPASLARDRRSIAIAGSHLDELSFYDADVSVNTTPDR